MLLRLPAPPSARWWWLWTATIVGATAAAFCCAGFALTDGVFPIPLDDTYIYFGFARSTALGHPFEWIPGNGYSSGSTSMLYPLLLAPGWALGLRGSWLGLWAVLIAARSSARRGPAGSCPP